ncbi:hypothetical protein SUGI_0221160 [Cryptomeria japonica]|nr:hypothetical protein SUGI_0221160 [Cryptomeria japonica]
MEKLFCNDSSDQIGVTRSAACVYSLPASIPLSHDQGNLFLEALFNGNINECPAMEYPVASHFTGPGMAQVDSTVINSTSLYSETDDYILESLTQFRSYSDLIQSGNISEVNPASLNPSIITMEGLSRTLDSAVFTAGESRNQSFEQLQNGFELPSFIAEANNSIPQMVDNKAPQTNYRMDSDRTEKEMSNAFYADLYGDQVNVPGPSVYGSSTHKQTNNSEDSGKSRPDALREMIYRLSAMQPVNIDPNTITRPKRRNVRISNDPQSVAARHRRERISDRIRILQRLVPGGTKMDTASMLDEAIHYVKFLQRQVQALESANSKPYEYPWSNNRQQQQQHPFSSYTTSPKLHNPATTPHLTLPINVDGSSYHVDRNIGGTKDHLDID